jgi:hypothetical protein
MRVTKKDLLRAFDAGIDAFLKDLNKAMDAQAVHVDQPGLPMDLPAATTPVQDFIGRYIEVFQKRYGPKARPDLGGIARGVAKRIVKDYGRDPAMQLVEEYLAMDDDWFLKKGHDLLTLEAQMQRVLLSKAGAGQGLSNLKKAAAMAGVEL